MTNQTNLFKAIFVFFFFFATCNAESLDRETYIKLLFKMDGYTSFQHISEAAIKDPALLEEVIFLTPGNNNHLPRMNSIIFLKHSSYAGFISKERFSDLIIKLLVEINNLAEPAQVDSEKKKISDLIARYAYDPRQTKPNILTVTEDFQFLLLVLSSMSSKGIISNQGMFQSIKQKIENAKKDIDKLNLPPALNTLNAALNEILAQDGKHITDAGAAMLTGYINNLVIHINKDFQNSSPGNGKNK